MGMSSTVELKVRAFNDEVKKKVREINLREYNILDWRESGPLLVMEDNNVAAGRNDFAELMEKIAAALNGEGMAYLIEYIEEDMPYATTYYCQGNGVKTEDFESDPEEDLYEMQEEMGEDANIDEVLDAASEKRHDSYIPRASWARGEDFTPEEKEMLKKYPW